METKPIGPLLVLAKLWRRPYPMVGNLEQTVWLATEQAKRVSATLVDAGTGEILWEPAEGFQ